MQLPIRSLHAGLALALLAPGLLAQQSGPLAVGAPAPDFALTGATADGVRPAPVRLSDFRDQTLVLAFFSRARTRG